LSPRAKRGVKLLALGSVALELSLVLGYVLLSLIPMLLSVAETGALTLAAGLLLVVAALAALVAMLWYDFFHLFKTGRSRFL
jgi:hypothetical protein